MRKLTIGFFIDSFYPMLDGVVKVTDHQARMLAKDHDVYVFAPKAKDASYVDDFPYHVKRVLNVYVPTTDYQLAIPPLDRKLNKELKFIAFDIIHIQSPFSMGELGIKIAQKQGIPVVGTLHSQYEKDFYDRTKSKTFTKVMLKDIMMRLNKCDVTMTMNEGSKALFMRYGLTKEPVIIPNATDMLPSKEDDLKAIKKKYNMKNVFNMIFVGRIDKIKNIDFIIDVIYTMYQQNQQFMMYFIGKGAHESMFKKRVEELKLKDVITFVGPIYDRIELSAMYAACDLLLFPSAYDTNGLVQIEAASQETPGIYLKDTLAASSIVDHYNGYICGDHVEHFANKILDIKTDKFKHKLISKQAKESLYITWEEVSEKLLEVYMSVLKEFKNE
jgi:1,2-diacylglycerol 3-alpha-glucosyltransferase